MRKAMAFPVRFVAEGQSVQTTSRDLDEESVFVRCVEPPREGEKVKLRLYLPGLAQSDPLPATVVEANGEGFRARFERLTTAQLTHVRDAVRAGEEVAIAVGAIKPRENRRAVPRQLAQFRVTLGSEQKPREGLNLSASGMYIETDAPPQLDEIVHVVLQIPDGKEPAAVQAIVQHRVMPAEGPRPGIGVQFIGADDSFRQRLDAWLERLRASGSRPSR